MHAEKRRTFLPALEDMDGREFRDPEVFLHYCSRNGIVGAKTAPSISVQSYADLDPDLKAAGVMVLRLGGSGAGTRFGLVRAAQSLEHEYFLRDTECFTSAEVVAFDADMEGDALYPFRVSARLQEGGAAGLALASGLIAKALNLDSPGPRNAPTTIASNFTFAVRPSRRSTVQWSHASGAVEIDLLVAGRRNGLRTLFLIESKHGAPGPGLSKHKLAYPILAMRERCPNVDMIPVYMRSWHQGSRVFFAFCECGWATEAAGIVSDLCVANPGRRFVIDMGM